MPIPNPALFDRNPMTLLYATLLGGPALRALWVPGGSTYEVGQCADISGQGRLANYNGNPTLNVYKDSIPYFDYDGTGDFHSRADEAALDLLGTETFVAAAIRGITMGVVFWADAWGTTLVQGLIGKWNDNGVNQRAYVIYADPRGGFTSIGATVSSNGTATTGVTTNISNAPIGRWHCAILRYKPSTELGFNLNGVWSLNTTSIPAALSNQASAFAFPNGNVGGAGAVGLLDGRIALGWLANAAWSDNMIEYTWRLVRQGFGLP